MVDRQGGARRKTRNIFKKNKAERGRFSIRNFFNRFNEGDRVSLVAEPSYHKGMYFRRFHGYTGKVVGKQGSCYLVEISDRGVKKKVLVHPIHLKRG